MRVKIHASPADAVGQVSDGATVLIGGFGKAGQPVELIEALLDTGASDLTIVSNNAGNGSIGLGALVGSGRVRRILCSFPRQADSHEFERMYRSGRIELELVPQGTLAERIRAGAAGIGGFFTPTGYGTELAVGKETRMIRGRGHVYEEAITADFALVKAHMADRAGNLVYRKTSRNFGPLMVACARESIVQVRSLVDVGGIDPEAVVTSGIYVDSLVVVEEVSVGSAA